MHVLTGTRGKDRDQRREGIFPGTDWVPGNAWVPGPAWCPIVIPTPVLVPSSPNPFMHCVLLADLAALISQHGAGVLHSRDTIPPEAMTAYWTATRNRLDLWHQVLKRHQTATEEGDYLVLSQWWKEHRGVLEEVFVGELLCRVMATLATNLDRRESVEEWSPVTHSVFLSHLEVSNRVQKILLLGRGHRVTDAVRLNRLRLGVARWVDPLIGRMSTGDTDSLQYAVDQPRAAKFADDYRSLAPGPSRRMSAFLLNASMTETLRRRTSDAAMLPAANAAIGRSVMLMLRPDLFDSVGVLKSLWLHRLQQSADRADRVVEELSQEDPHSETIDAMESVHHDGFGRWYMT